MPSKKKPKPQFDLPEESESPSKAGWVYRSAATAAKVVEPAPAPPPAAKPRAETPPYSLASAGAKAVGYSAGMAANMFFLGTRVVALPARIAMRFLGND